MKLGGPNACQVAEGDVLGEWGRRIGTRYWLVVLVEQARTLWHAVVVAADLDEVQAAAKSGGQIWSLT